MDYERFAIFDNFTNNLTMSFKAFTMLRDKYNGLQFNQFLLLVSAKRLQDKTGGYFLTLDLCKVTGLQQKYVYDWLESCIIRDFIKIPSERSVFELSEKGLLAVRQFRRNLWRLMNN